MNTNIYKLFVKGNNKSGGLTSHSMRRYRSINCKNNGIENDETLWMWFFKRESLFICRKYRISAMFEVNLQTPENFSITNIHSWEMHICNTVTAVCIWLGKYSGSFFWGRSHTCISKVERFQVHGCLILFVIIDHATFFYCESYTNWGGRFFKEGYPWKQTKLKCLFLENVFIFKINAVPSLLVKCI